MPATLRRTSAARVVGLLVATAVLVVVVAPLPSSAHGSLVVPTARLQAQGDTVEVAWSAAEDDTAAIAVALGMAPRQALLDHLAALAALDDGADPQPLVDELVASVDRDQLAGSPQLHAYLLGTIEVHQGQQPCAGTVGPTATFLTDGVTLTFRCPAPIDTIDLTVTVLMDQDPTHRTFSTDGRGDVALHTAAAPTQTWQLDAAAGSVNAARSVDADGDGVAAGAMASVAAGSVSATDGLTAIAVGLAASATVVVAALTVLGRRRVS